MRAAGIVLGALGLFGSPPGELSEADLLVGQTLAHVACVAILQEHPPTPDTVMPRLRSALASRVVVEQAKGFLRESLDVSVADAFRLLRTYAHTTGQHLTDLARRLMTDRGPAPSWWRPGRARYGADAARHLRRARARLTASSTSRSATTRSLTFSAWLMWVSRSNASSALAPDRLRMMPMAWSITVRLLIARCRCSARSRLGQQFRVIDRHRRGPGELRTQLHGVLAERVAVHMHRR